jgi:hypothetical protein
MSREGASLNGEERTHAKRTTNQKSFAGNNAADNRVDMMSIKEE